jgi:phage terminase large subunit
MYTLTAKQQEAVKLISEHKEILLEGGSRSGKTFIAVMACLTRAIKYDGSRHLIARYRFNHAKQSIWYGTLPEVAALMGISYKENKADWFIELSNGSQIWLGGLDDKERTEKILGNEYATIYLNEASQMAYSTYQIVKTRLNPNKGVPAKLIIDYNPPSRRHWGYVLFHAGNDPLTQEPLKHKSLMGYMRMNPRDNVDNLSDGYIETLESLSERERTRFLDGEYLDPQGSIYHRFNEAMILDKAPACDEYIAGVDLITYAAVLIGRLSGQIIIVDEIGGEDLIASELNRLMVERWSKYKYQAFIDWNLSKSGTREFDNSRMAIKGAGSVEAGIDCINKYMENGNFYLVDSCYKTRASIEDYRRDDNGRIIKENDHFCDALRYAVFSTEQVNGRINKVIGW